MYLLHTAVLEEILQSSPEATRWLRSVDPRTVYLSALSFVELARTVSSRVAADPISEAGTVDWLRRLRHDHRERILDVTDAIAVECGRMNDSVSSSEVDRLIAATAIEHDMVLVVRNSSEFGGLGVDVICPWSVADIR